MFSKWVENFWKASFYSQQNKSRPEIIPYLDTFHAMVVITLHHRFIIPLWLISKLHLVYAQSSVHLNNSNVQFLSFLIWMRTFQTDNRTFIVGIMKIDQCSLHCCSGVFISTLSKYLSDKLYHYTNYDCFSITISSYITFCHHLLYTCQ